ncbi:MAG: hypothetical protein QM820_17540 [Minicystis sp.]
MLGARNVSDPLVSSRTATVVDVATTSRSSTRMHAPRLCRKYPRVIAIVMVVLAACSAEPRVVAPVATASGSALASPPATPLSTASAVADNLPSQPIPAKVKFVGSFVRDFSGEYRQRAEEVARKAAGPNDKDGLRHRAEIEKAARAAEEVTLELTDRQEFLWKVKGKLVEPAYFMIDSADHPTDLAIKLQKGEQGMRTRLPVFQVTFIDDDTFSMKDPFEREQSRALTLIFKRRR